jgi:hypothetical protein
MNWEAEDIKKNIYNIMIDSKKMKKNDLEKKYSQFIFDNEKLYNIAIESVVSGKVQETIKMLDAMLATRDKIRNGSMNKDTADMFIGNQLGHKYIYPISGVPSQEDYKNAIGKIKEQIKENDKEMISENI